MLSSTNRQYVVFFFLLVLCAFARWVSSTPGFVPVLGASLYLGWYSRSRVAALCFPLIVLASSDVILGFYSAPLMIAVYLSAVIPPLLGLALRKKLAVSRIVAFATTASLAQFLIVNLAWWRFFPGYPATPGGLAQCYAAALPFFANRIAADLIWTTIIFAGASVLSRYLPADSVADAPVQDSMSDAINT